MEQQPTQTAPPRQRGGSLSTPQPQSTSRTGSRRRPPEDDKDKKDKDATSGEFGPKFRTKKRVLILEIVIVILLWIDAFSSPDSGGGAGAIVHDTSTNTYVGLLSECSGGTCSDWMSTSVTISGISVDLSTLFLTTGLGVVFSFYLSLTVLFFSLFIRSPFSHPPDPHFDPLDHNTGKKRPLAGCFNGSKKLAYHASRLILMINLFAVLGEAGVCVQVAVTAGSSGSAISSSSAAVSAASYIGTGTYLLWIAFVLLLFSLLIDVMALRWLSGTPGFIARLNCCPSWGRSTATRQRTGGNSAV